MAFTQNDHDEITAAVVALGKGDRVARVQFSSGKSVEYSPANLAELKALRNEIASEIAAAAGTSSDFCYIQSGKGF